MRRKTRSRIADQTIVDIEQLYQQFYRSCILKWVPQSDQWDLVLELLRRLRACNIRDDESADIAGLNDYLQRVVADLSSAIEAKELRSVVITAIRFGHFFRYAFDLVDRPDIASGRNAFLGGRKGNQSAYGTPQELADRNKKMQVLINKLMRDDRRMPYAKACRHVATEFDVSAATVKLWTKNPRRKNI
jgi:hypothetical protein